MLRWLRLVMIGCLILSIASIATGCKLSKKKTATETKSAVEEKAPVEEEEGW